MILQDLRPAFVVMATYANQGEWDNAQKFARLANLPNPYNSIISSQNKADYFSARKFKMQGRVNEITRFEELVNQEYSLS